MRNQAVLRELRTKKIQQRIRLLKNKTRTWSVSKVPAEPGYLANNNEVNARMGAGKKKKTNTRKSCASYRHHGGYGPANRYMPHDRRQIDDLIQQLDEEDLKGSQYE